MDFLLLVNIFRYYLSSKIPLDKKLLAKCYFRVRVTFGMKEFLCKRWKKSFHLVDSLVMKFLFWTLFYVNQKSLHYMQNYLMLLEQFDHILAGDLAIVIWLDKVQTLAGLVLLGLLFCLYGKIFVPSIFNSVDFWNYMSLILLDLGLTEKNLIKELELFWWLFTGICILSTRDL